VVAPHQTRPIETLLVEDDPGEVLLAREALDTGDARCHLTVVSDGVEAMAFLRQAGVFRQALRPDLVLLDLNLPRKDGRQVLAEIKGDPTLLTIPVVILTTSSAEEDVLQSYRLHANAYVTKPANVDEFLRAVRIVDEFFGNVAARPPTNGKGPHDPTMTVSRDVDAELYAEAIPHIVWLASPDGSTEYFNRHGTDYAGVSSDVNYGWDWVSLVHPDDADRALKDWQHAIRTRKPLRMDCRIRRHDGEFHWHTFRAEVVRDYAGRVVKWIGTATDIEDQKRFQAELEQSRRKSAELATLLDTLQASAPVGFGFMDQDSRIVRMNAPLAAVMGVSLEEDLGRLGSEVVPDIWHQVESSYRGVLETGEPVVNLEVDAPRSAELGPLHHCLASFYPVRLDGAIIGVGIVVVDITERKEAEDARKHLTRAVISAMAATVEARDPYTAGHQMRVARISAAIAREMGLSEFEIEGISLAASIHDLGKIGVPVEILNRSRALGPAELELVRRHAKIGHDIVSGIDFPWPVAEMVLRHHERCDGSGYPDGLKGSGIVVGAKIIGVADTLEAMACDRPYRAALGLNAALEFIQGGRGKLFDPAIVDACTALFRSGRLAIA
jgi:PAS domain S-box-containing protein